MLARFMYCLQTVAGCGCPNIPCRGVQLAETHQLLESKVLCCCAQDAALEAGPGSRLAVVVDGHGREVERNLLVAREQTVGPLAGRACEGRGRSD